MLLEGKTVVVTGANGALGRVAASVAAGHGAHVIEFDLAFEADAENRYVVDLTRPEVVAGVLADESTALLEKFFGSRR